ncbi:MAG: T9SS type A sorting domain-containing protein, partial [Bacteroidota bacterium]
NTGALFWRSGKDGYLYRVPVEGNARSLFTAALMIGGIVENELRMSASEYGPYELWPGDLAGTLAEASDCVERDRMYSVFKRDLLAFENGEPATQDLIDWPWQLGAPVTDGDGNPDNYDLAAGDRPEILGHQTIWWVMNDAGGEHRWSGRPALNMEVQITAFAAASDVPAVDTATFYRYRLVYGGESPLENAYFGFSVDPDVGDAADDYVGVDTLLGIAYSYNGDEEDGGPGGYGSRPPAVGFAFLETPGDAGLTNFHYYNGDSTIQGNMNGGLDAYNYLQSRWRDGSPVTVGGTGLGFSEEPTTYMFSGFPGDFWSESNTDGNGATNTSGDRRFLFSSGPFSLQPGETADFVFAIAWAQGTDHIDSVRELQDAVTDIRSVWDAGFETPLPSLPQQAPILLSPAPGVPNQPINGAFIWSDAGEHRYRFQLGLSPTFETLAAEEIVADKRFSADSLAAESTYYWRVQAINSAGGGPWSETASFSTGTDIIPNQELPLLLGSGPAFVQVAAPNGFDPCGSEAVSTAGCVEVGGNSVYASLDGTGELVLYNQGAGTETVIGNYTPRDFEIRFTEEGSIGAHPFTSGRGHRVPMEAWDIGPVGPFNENDPSDDVQMIVHLFAENQNDLPEEEIECTFGYTSIAEDPFGLGWPGTQRVYAYYPATTYSAFADIAQTEVDAAGGCAVLSDAAFEEVDFGRGRPIQRTVFYGRPDTTTFRTEGPRTGHVFRFYTRPAQAPILASPANAAALPGGTLDLYWYGGDLLQIGIDSEFERVILETASETGSTSSVRQFTVPALRAGRYYWRAGLTTDRDTLWSAPWSFTVATPVDTEAETTIPTTLTIRAGYPNPFASTTTLPYGLPEATDVSASVFDLLGRRVATLAQNERRPAGWHELRINGKTWPSGVYFVELTAGDQRVSRRLVKIN